jgi:hypothetical protein
MGLGKKAFNSRIDKLIYMNMGMQKYSRRSYVQEIDFTEIQAMMKDFNRDRPPRERLRIPAVLMKAIALSYDFTGESGEKPYRRLSGYLPFFPWGGSWESDRINISLMIVRELDGVKHQTCAYTFRDVEKMNSVELSKNIYDVSTRPEDEIPEFVALKKTARLPLPFLYLMMQLMRIPKFRAMAVAPTSVSVLPVDIKLGQGEHTSMFGLVKINPETNRGMLQWTFDHRLGMGIHFGPFLEHLKRVMDSAEFLKADVEEYLKEQN